MAEQRLDETTRHLKLLRRLARAGDAGRLPLQLAQAPGLADRLAEAVRVLRDGFSYDASEAFADGSYAEEIKAEARRQGVLLVDRDGRLSAFPFAVKLDAAIPAVRIGRKPHRGLRPAELVKALRAAQAGSRFNPVQFLDLLLRAYHYLAPDWARRPAGDGPAVPLTHIHDLLTIAPAADYPREAFACDLLRLNRTPDARSRRGHGFDLPASTGSKGRDRILAYDETGAEHVFVAIRFLAPAAEAARA